MGALREKVKRVAVIFAVLASPSMAQQKAGTLIVLYLSDDKAILAGDSRALVVADGKVIREDDTQCKVLALSDKTIFGFSGYSHYVKSSPIDPAPEYDAGEIARRAYRDNPTAIFGMVSQWAKSMADNMNAVERAHPSNLKFLSGRIGGAGIFAASTYYGEIRAYAGVLDYTSDNLISPITYRVLPLAPCTTKIGPYCPSGRSEIFNEFSQLTSPRSIREAADWDRKTASKATDNDALRAIRLIDLTEQYSTILFDGHTDVGGKVDSVLIQRGGTVEWVARKQECPAN